MANHFKGRREYQDAAPEGPLVGYRKRLCSVPPPPRHYAEATDAGRQEEDGRRQRDWSRLQPESSLEHCVAVGQATAAIEHRKYRRLVGFPPYGRPAVVKAGQRRDELLGLPAFFRRR